MKIIKRFIKNYASNSCNKVLIAMLRIAAKGLNL